MIRLDTHVVVWLYTNERSKLSSNAIERIEADDVSISPLVELELTFLNEIGRLTIGGPTIVADLRERIGLKISEQTTSSIVAAANSLTWARDPFDRMIVGDAMAANNLLLTRDRKIREHTDIAFW